MKCQFLRGTRARNKVIHDDEHGWWWYYFWRWDYLWRRHYFWRWYYFWRRHHVWYWHQVLISWCISWIFDSANSGRNLNLITSNMVHRPQIFLVVHELWKRLVQLVSNRHWYRILLGRQTCENLPFSRGGTSGLGTNFDTDMQSGTQAGLMVSITWPVLLIWLYFIVVLQNYLNSNSSDIENTDIEKLYLFSNMYSLLEAQ